MVGFGWGVVFLAVLFSVFLAIGFLLFSLGGDSTYADGVETWNVQKHVVPSFQGWRVEGGGWDTIMITNEMFAYGDYIFTVLTMIYDLLCSMAYVLWYDFLFNSPDASVSGNGTRAGWPPGLSPTTWSDSFQTPTKDFFSDSQSSCGNQSLEWSGLARLSWPLKPFALLCQWPDEQRRQRRRRREFGL